MDDKDPHPSASLHTFPIKTAPVAEEETLAPGQIELVRTYLEMFAPPAPWRGGRRSDATAIMRAHECTTSFYRYLYDTVGQQWLWYDRRQLPLADLRDIIEDPLVEIYVLYCQGTPAGFGELDRRQGGDLELAYFGLLPDFIGRGLGPYFLHWLQNTAWSHQPDRLWVHTCTFDHPSAMALYQRAGFKAYRQERSIIDVPGMD